MERQQERERWEEYLLAQLNVLGDEGVGGGLGEARGDLGAAEFEVALEEGLLPLLVLLPLVALRCRPVHLQHVPATMVQSDLRAPVGFLARTR